MSSVNVASAWVASRAMISRLMRSIAALLVGLAVATPAAAIDSTRLSVSGLRAPVEVMRDRWGVSHIYAANTHDLFFTQGYLAAKTRMWQIELWRRNATGTLAEVLGPDYVERDTFARMLKFRGDWQAELSHYHPEGPVIFAAFADGVNAAIREALASGELPIEFALSGFKPESQWHAQTVAARVVSAAVSKGAAAELMHALAMKNVGVKKARSLLLVEPPTQMTVPAGLDLTDIVPEILNLMRDFNSFKWNVPAPLPASAPSAEQDSGSNNWVLAGHKTVSGRPLLVSDPHRALDNPSMRYWVHLVAPGWNVIGMADAGLPGVGIGHNEHVAWGWTNLNADTQDIYVEETGSGAADRYRYRGQWLPMQVYREEIRVKGRSPVTVDIKMTRHGPVIHEDAARRRAYALRMPGSEVGDAGFFLGSFGVLQAKNWKEFSAGSAKWSAPTSVVYADTQGNTGFLTVGRIPVRRNWDGLLPVPGREGKYEWAGYIPADQLPRSSNDPRGFYASANNNVLSGLSLGDPTRFGHAFSPSYRFDRIIEFLGQPRRFDLADMRRLQTDVVSLPARELVPLLARVKSPQPEVQWAIDKLLAWDRSLDATSLEASLYEYWRLRLVALTYAIKIPPAQLAAWRNWDLRRVIAWLQSPDTAFGSDPTARRDEILLTALEQALQLIRDRAGTDKSGWAWGNLHQAPFAHPLSRPETASTFAVPRIPRGGDEFTVQASNAPSVQSADQTNGASIMMILDVGEWDRSIGLNVPGNEGNAQGRHYGDLARPWGAGEYFPLAFSKAKVREVTRERWLLRPAAIMQVTAGESAEAIDGLLKALVSDARVVALGEPLHGAHEPLELRNRIFATLVQEHGFTAIAVETDFLDGAAIDDYVGGGGELTDALVAGVFSFKSPQAAQENRDLLEWMRAYNSRPDTPRKLRFYGLEMNGRSFLHPHPRAARPLDTALQFLARVDAAGSRRYRERLQPMLTALAETKPHNKGGWPSPYSKFTPSKRESFTAAIADLVAEFERRAVPWIASTSRSEYERGYRSLLNARALDADLRANGWWLGCSARSATCDPDQRDAASARNLQWVLEQEQPQGRVMLFAHNTHVRRGPSRNESGALEFTSLGQQLDARLGNEFMVIGSFFDETQGFQTAQTRWHDGLCRTSGDSAPSKGRVLNVNEGFDAILCIPALTPWRVGVK